MRSWPFSLVMRMRRNSPILSAEIQIGTTRRLVEALAVRHGITDERTPLDDYAEVVTQLSGDDIHMDSTDRLLVALGRAKVISGVEVFRLMDSHRNDLGAL